MENKYSAYTRMVNDVKFFVVKKYTVFTEYSDQPDILESMGMHKNFYKACRIAKIDDEEIVKDLLSQLPAEAAPVTEIRLHGVRAVTRSLARNTFHLISKLRLAGIN
jgi:hypothetical protein